MKNDRPNSTDFGDTILDKIGECLDDMNYSALGDSIRESVDFIREEAEKGYKTYRVNASKEREKYSQYMGTPYQRHMQSQAQARPNMNRPLQRMPGPRNPNFVNPNMRNANVPNAIIPRIQSLPGKIAGPVEMGFGIAGLSLFGGMSIIGLFATVFAGAGGTAGVMAGASFLLGSLVMTAVSGGLLGHGIFGKKRADRIQKYSNFIMNKEFVMIDDLVKFSGEEEKTVRKDIKYMIANKISPSMSMDEKETCLLFTDHARNQYAEAEKSRLERELEELRQKEEKEILERKKALASKEEKEFYEFEDQINLFIEELKKVRNEIDSPVMLEHANQVESLLVQIYNCIKDHPEMIYGTGHLISYYLPCMSKLFKTYEDLEEQPIQGDNIQKTKMEIEKSFETIEAALTNMYDELFQEVSMDISSDIQVLKTVMAQDGLNEGGF